ncbi:hypothetical protein BDZ89DRAFT_1068222 [Hymenopellis radicata]|nr:hypothetical protein BDZ89DRAFT_1068222 [Hymenopellis radicata]
MTMPTPTHPPSEEYHKTRRHLPPAAHLMNVDEKQMLIFGDMKETDLIIAYAMGGIRPQPDEDELYRGVKRALESLIPSTPNTAITMLRPSHNEDARWNFPVRRAIITGLQSAEKVALIEADVLPQTSQFPWQLAFHDPGDGVRTIVAVVTDLSLDESVESCEKVYDMVAGAIRRSGRVREFVEANRDLYPPDASTMAIIEHMCSSLDVSPHLTGPTIFNLDTSHSFIVHIPPTTADIVATKEMVLMLNEMGIRIPHGWGDADDAYMHVLCRTCFGMDHLAEDCRCRGGRGTYTD